MSDDSSSSYSSGEEDEFRDDMRVFLRLRPINKLEQSRRSKNCIELHEDPTLVTVDSPLEGEYDYTFDHVFEEYASQEEVYEQAMADIPDMVLQGYNATVLAYGQTGTGKTHTMMGSHLYTVKRGLNQTVGESLRSMGEPSEAFPSTTFSEADEDLDGDIAKEGKGLIPRTIQHLFDLIKEKEHADSEFTIKVSYIEIYLEKILDLLHPSAGGNLSMVEIKDGGVMIDGAAEVCCFDSQDVLALLARGNACRTMSSTELNTDSSRSHAIFILKVEQRNPAKQTTKTSVLHMVDLAGSELGQANPKRKSIAANISAIQTEALMINKSLSALQKLIRAQLAHQEGDLDVPLSQISRQSKLTKLLRPAFGGNCLTTLILTASPSSYNIGETISTINFGQRCRRIYNDPQIREWNMPMVYQQKLQEIQDSYQDAMALVRALASECLRLREGTSSQTGPLWDTIQGLGQMGPVDFKVTIKKRKLQKSMDDSIKMMDETEMKDDSEVVLYANERVKLEDTIETLREENEHLSRLRLDAEGQLAELQSEVAVLRTQNENLTADKKRNVEELVNAKNEVQVLSQRKLEVEHNLRTSQFRENEAIVFLRQFRRFYRNVLRDKAAHGAGSIQAITSEVTDKVPNAPNLNELRDVDCLLVESGLLEEHELGEDRSSGNYLPSKDALIRSAKAAQRSADIEAELNRQQGVEVEGGGDDDDDESHYVAQTITRVTGPLRLPGPGSTVPVDHEEQLNDHSGLSISEDDERAHRGADAGAGAPDDRSVLSEDAESLAQSMYSISRRRTPAAGTIVTRKQRALKTPAGRLTNMRENSLEKELLEMSERCIDLQMALNEEKAVVDALTNKSGGLSKKRLAQEAISLRQQLEKKTASLTAIAWKMNELNLINKTYNEKMANREQHVLYLEEQLVELQNNNRRLIVDRAENEKKLREEIDNLHGVVGGMTVPLWQFGEARINEKPLASRIIISLSGGDHAEHEEKASTTKRRRSIGAEEPEVVFPDIPDYPLYETVENIPLAETIRPRDESESYRSQTDETMDESEQDPLSEPKRPKRRPSDRMRMSAQRLKAMRSITSQGASIKEEEPERTFETVSTQTDEVRVFGMDEVLPVSESKISPGGVDASSAVGEVAAGALGTAAMVAAVKAAECRSVETQTDEIEMDEVEVQTDRVQIFNVNEGVEPVQERLPTEDAGVQTEQVHIFDTGIDLIPHTKDKLFDVETQTEEQEMYEVGLQTDSGPLTETYDTSVQTGEIGFVGGNEMVSKEREAGGLDNVKLYKRDMDRDKGEETGDMGTATVPTAAGLGAAATVTATAVASLADNESEEEEGNKDESDDESIEMGYEEVGHEEDEAPYYVDDSGKGTGEDERKGGIDLGHVKLVTEPAEAITIESFHNELVTEEKMAAPSAQRFMPEEPLAQKRGVSRFMPDEDTKYETNRPAKARRNLLGNEEIVMKTSRNIEPSKEPDGDGFGDIEDYDNFGKRWGLSEDEIAADAAVLVTPRLEERQSLLNNQGLYDDALDEVEKLDYGESRESFANASMDGLERDLFDNDFEEHRRVIRMESLDDTNKRYRTLDEEFERNTYAYESEPEEVKTKESADTFNDDFEKMMSETAAALAAADELMPDDTLNDYSKADLDLDVTDEEVDFDDEDSEENDEYESDEAEDDDVDDEYSSAQVDRSPGREKTLDKTAQVEEVRSTSLGKAEEEADPSMFDGGRPPDYEPKRYVTKLGNSIRAAVVNESSRRNYDNDDGSLVSMSTQKNRELPQLAGVARRQPDEDQQRQDESSRRREEERKMKKKRSHRHRSHREEDGEDHRRTRSSRDLGDEEGRRHRRKGEDGEERRHKSSRRHKSGEEGDEERLRRRHRSDGGEEVDEERRRRHKSDDARKRKKKSSKEHRAHRSGSRRSLEEE